MSNNFSKTLDKIGKAEEIQFLTNKLNSSFYLFF